MTDNRPADVRGPVLKWARERWGLTREEAAAALAVEPAVIDAWERNEASPTADQLVQLSKEYAISLSDLLRAEPPEEEHVPDFRAEPEAPEDRPYDLKRSLIFARDDQCEASYIAGDLGRPVPPKLPFAAAGDDPAEAGMRVRRMLCDGAGDAHEADAFADWRCRVEELGVLVFAYPMPRGRCSGIALWRDDQIPVIAVNARDGADANSFALMHGLGHILRRRSAIYNVCDAGAGAPEKSFCDEFASAVLGRPSLDWPAADSEANGAAAILDRLWAERPDGRDDPAFFAAEAHRMGRGYVSLVLDGCAAGEIDIIDTCLALGLVVAQIRPVAEVLGIPDRVPSDEL